MDVHTELLHDSALEDEGTSNIQRHLFQQWERTGGLINDNLHQYLLRLTDDLVLFGMPIHSDIPAITHVGRKSLAGKVMGSGWRSELKNLGNDDAVAAAYRRACQGEPTLEQVKFTTTRHGKLFVLEYKRLVLMIRTPKGFPFLATFSTQERLGCEPHPLASLQNRVEGLRPSNSHVLLGSDAEPIARHSLSA